MEAAWACAPCRDGCCSSTRGSVRVEKQQCSASSKPSFKQKERERGRERERERERDREREREGEGEREGGREGRDGSRNTFFWLKMMMLIMQGRVRQRDKQRERDTIFLAQEMMLMLQTGRARQRDNERKRDTVEKNKRFSSSYQSMMLLMLTFFGSRLCMAVSSNINVSPLNFVTLHS